MFFIREPRKMISYDDTAILSPANGLVCYCKRINPGEEIFSIKNNKKIRLDDLMYIEDSSILRKPGWLIGIMMTVFDVHYNYAPISGYITKIRHEYPTKQKMNSNMLSTEINIICNRKPYWKNAKYLVTNERASYLLKNNDFSVYITQIADKWIKKIVTLKDNQEIKPGEIFGIVKMGSQVDVFIPEDNETFQVLVKERQRVNAGVTKLVKKKMS